MTEVEPAEAQDASLVEIADGRYRDRNWSAALVLYRALQQRNPTLARQSGVPLALGHCLIELQDDADPAALTRDLMPGVPWEARVDRAFWLRVRAVELCRAGDFARARRLLKFLAMFDPSIGMVYAEGFMKGRSGCWEPYLGGTTETPGFLHADRWTDAQIAATKTRFRGLRVLLVMPWTYPYGTGDRYARSAGAFGLSARMLDRTELLAGVTPAAAALRLNQQIQDFRPDIVICNSVSELPAGDPAHDLLVEEIGRVLAAARNRLGARVVDSFNDAWFLGPEILVRGLGESVDLIHHSHPELLQDKRLDDPRVYCFLPPHLIAAPTVEPGSTARACAVGSINYANAGRAVWWAEAAPSELPLDFYETHYMAAGMLTPERYADLLCAHQITVNLTRRTSGAKIVTGRALEALLAGGFLLDEDSVNTRYFLQPGAHYLPFETWTDLTELIPWLLANPDYTQRIAGAGRRWVEQHFTGDWFWAGLLGRLFPDAG